MHWIWLSLVNSNDFWSFLESLPPICISPIEALITLLEFPLEQLVEGTSLIGGTLAKEFQVRRGGPAYVFASDRYWLKDPSLFIPS